MSVNQIAIQKAMDIGLKTLTLNTPNLNAMADFFSTLGFAVERQKVDKGSECCKIQAGATEITLMSIPQRQRSSTPDIALRIQVQKIDEVVKKLRDIASVQIIMDVEFLNEGKTAMVVDPDGRSIELLGFFKD